MTLLSPLALLFGLAATVPLLLHLYQRRRRQVIHFSTNRFFTEAIVRSQRRLRLRRWLLLLLRMAACVALALALAQPLLSIAGLGAVGGQRDLVVVLDDSLSMAATRAAGGGTAFETALTLVDETLGELTSGDRAAIVTLSGRAIEADDRAGGGLTADLAALRKRVRSLQPTRQAGDARTALDRAAALFRYGEQRARQCLILTDGQRGDWSGVRWPEPRVGVVATLIKLDPPATRNLIVSAEPLPARTVIGQPNVLRLRLTNVGDRRLAGRLLVEHNGEPLADRPVELAGWAQRTIPIPLAFEKPGAHHFHVVMEVDDALAADNLLHLATEAAARLPVLIIDGAAAELVGATSDRVSRPRNAAFYLRSALEAGSTEGAGVRTRIATPEQARDLTLAGYRVVVLSEVAAMPAALTDRLVRFVRNGGGLLVFTARQADPRFYNRLAAGDAADSDALLPAGLESWIDRREGEPLSVRRVEASHPVFESFDTALHGALSSVQVYQAWALANASGSVLASLNGERPLLVEQQRGAGRVVLAATAFHPDATSLPLRRVCVPLLGRLLAHVSAVGERATNHEVGRPLILADDPAAATQPPTVITPSGARIEAIPSAEGPTGVSLASRFVDRPGLYRIQWPTIGSGMTAPTEGLDGPHRPTILAVNAPRRESDPAHLAATEMAARADGWTVSTLDVTEASASSADAEPDPRQAIVTLLDGAPVDRGVWDVLLWVVLGLVIAEPMLANLLFRVRRAEAASVEAESATAATRSRRAA